MNSKKWITRQSKDMYVKKRTDSKLFVNYYARSAFKLIEMHQKYSLFKSNMTVGDFGCSPGSWSQVLIEYKCKVIGYDILDCQLEHPLFDFCKLDVSKADINLFDFDFIVSDMAPNLTGNKIRDISNNIYLNSMLLPFIRSNTKGLICKAFMSPLQREYEQELSKHFTSVLKFKPKSSRSSSSEYYYIATSLRK
eukprot:NODE_600_length_6246_cov_0.137628.p3 type:complete len:194 gc:universal NODE_600_length_6246_cov_0.137628:5097-5678(+)